MTKSIEGEKQKANWENHLLKDLVFIKKHGRYPFNRKTLTPTIALALFVVIIGRFTLPLVLIKNNNYIAYIAAFIILASIISTVYQYYNTILFRRIKTNFFIPQNQQILQSFFEAQQLAYTRHTDAPEVYMILSKNLSMNSNEYREVMIFITDDKQILINSHFTGKRLTITPPSKHYKQMAKRLEEWIDIHINNSNTSIASTNKF